MNNFKVGDMVSSVLGIDYKITSYYFEKENEQFVTVEGHDGYFSSSMFTLMKSDDVINDTEVFDITADISRQYTRDGNKVDFIVDTKKDISGVCRVLYHVEGHEVYQQAKLDGMQFNHITGYDLVTRPEVKPSKFMYVDVYLDEMDQLNIVEFDSLYALRKASECSPDCTTLSIELVEYNPNTNKITRTEIPIK